MPNFFEAVCRQSSNRSKFGICDAPDDTPAYLDETNGGEWIAVVENGYQETVSFTAIDHCIEMLNPDGTTKSRCDGMLSYAQTVIFVELKDRNVYGNAWIKEGDNQLRTTIGVFESSEEAAAFNQKKAYIANKARPKFRESQMARMEQFKQETGYVLRIENRIKID